MNAPTPEQAFLEGCKAMQARITSLLFMAGMRDAALRVLDVSDYPRFSMPDQQVISNE